MSFFTRILGLFLVFSFCQTSMADYGPRSCFKHRQKRKGFAWDARRGNPWDFDTGPASEDAASWVKLYGQLPNYRSVGRAILGGDDEKFRWTMGPMWYRGRLGKNQVKVFVVGQEGAQDENITNRAFTGSTGTRVQKFLNHLGIYESYLFMNTYVYTIKDQRDTGSKKYMALEQNLSSPIVHYRHMLFDNVIKQNPDSINLFMAVGGGGKESLATWINARSGNNNCDDKSLNRCDLSGVVKYFADRGIIKNNKKLLAIGVNHPGGAAFGGGSGHIQKSFDNAASSVAWFIRNNKDWLPADDQDEQFAQCIGGNRMARLNKSFEYGHAPVPFKDFSFGTNWRMGDKGTASNRARSHRIQVFSEEGQYATVYIPSKEFGKVKLDSGRTVWNDWMPEYFSDERSTRSSDFKGLSWNQIQAILRMGTYTFQPLSARSQLRDPRNGLLQEMKNTEVPYEHPRYKAFGSTEAGDFAHAAAFDPGPASKQMAEALGNWPNFQEINKAGYFNNESFGFGPSYRGNTKNPSVMIIADQMGHADFFSTRALTGTGGQKLQSFLKATGLEASNSYLIVRSLPVDTLNYGDTLKYMETLSEKNLKKKDIRYIPTAEKIKLALGSDSKERSAVDNFKRVLGLIEVPPTVIAMGPVAEAIAGKLGVPFIKMDQPGANAEHAENWASVANQIETPAPTKEQLLQMTSIPRKDLPYSTRWWMGTSGDRAERAFGDSIAIENFNYEGHYYRVVAPDWARTLYDDPRPLGEFEKSLIGEVMTSLTNPKTQ